MAVEDLCQANIRLKPSKHEYRFLVNGQWQDEREVVGADGSLELEQTTRWALRADYGRNRLQYENHGGTVPFDSNGGKVTRRKPRSQ